MGFPKLLLLALLAVECYIESVQAWGPNVREIILNLHNAKRRDEGACGMNALTYSMRLEERTKQWTEKCDYGHEGSGFGENIARFRSKKNETQLAAQGIELWWNERTSYNESQPNCGFSCHYTQIVNGETKEVGCYLVDCYEYKFYACYYWPPANYPNKKPFTRECDFPCDEDQTPKDRLCYDEDYEPFREVPTTTAETSPPPATTTKTTTTPTTTTTTTPPTTPTTTTTTTTTPTTTTTTTPTTTTTTTPTTTTTTTPTTTTTTPRTTTTTMPTTTTATTTTERTTTPPPTTSEAALANNDGDKAPKGSRLHSQTNTTTTTTTITTTTTTTTPSTTSTENTNVPTYLLPRICVDKARICLFLVKLRSCDTISMIRQCQKTCNLC